MLRRQQPEWAAMTGNRRLTLASGSPRRRVLLRRAGFVFTIVSPNIDETPQAGEPPAGMVARLAKQKAESVAQSADPKALVLGADTAVVLDGEALGKPADPEDATLMLLSLGGRHHEVVTGYCLWEEGAGPVAAATALTKVGFRRITRAEADEYVATGEPLDKAGAYAIQGLGRTFVSEIRGSFTNVMGLPMEEIEPLLRSYGLGASSEVAP